MAEDSPMCRICKVVQAKYSCSCMSPATHICEACLSVHSSMESTTGHDSKPLPRPPIEVAPTSCAICHNSTPEFVCVCKPNGPGFCGGACQSMHQSTRGRHLFLPISERGKITDKEYLKRLEKKQNAYRQGKQTLKNNLHLVDVCRQKVENRAELAIEKITKYKENVIRTLDAYKLKLEKLILTVESELELHMHDHDYVPTKPLMAATLYNHNPALRLFSYECERHMYRVWYEAKLEPSKDTLPVHSPHWAAINSESKEENKEPKSIDENIKPQPQKVPPQPPKVPRQPPKAPSQPPKAPSQPPKAPSQPPKAPSQPPPSQPSAPIQSLTTTSSQLPDNRSPVEIKSPVLVTDQLSARAPPAPTSLVYFSLTSETISRSVSLSTPIGVSTWASAVLLLDGNLLTCGGNEPISSDVHLINPVTGLVNRLASMKYQRYAHGLVLFRENIYVFGGKDDSNPLSYCEKYANKAWEELESMNTPRSFFNPCVIGDTAFLMGGKDTTNCEKYFIESNSFENLAVKLPMAGWTSAVYLSDQEMLIVQRGLIVKWEVGSGIVEGKREQAEVELGWGSMSPVVFRNKAYIPRFYEGTPLQVDI